MAGDKKKKNVSASPFRQLKGFCVSGGTGNETPPPAPPPRSPEPDVDFAAEMARLGVKGVRAGEAPPRVARAPEAPAPAEAADDRSLFLDALGKFDTTFADEVPAPPAGPRLKKLLQNDRFVPDGELDLHGLDRQRARERVRYFLEDAVYQGKKTALLITGRGHGSNGEPVLRTEVENFLRRESAPWVAEWATAPRRLGGDGAFVVALRGKRKK